MGEKTEFSFPSADGKTQIRALRWMPDEGTKIIGIVQIIHGMQEFIDRYDAFASYLTGQGYIVTGNDLLGHGSSIRGGDENYWGYFGKNACSGQQPDIAGETCGNQNMIRDIRHLQMLTADLFPSLPYFILGHSMGSFFARQYLCIHGNSLAGAVISGTAFHARPETLGGLFMARFIAHRKGWFYRSPFLNRLTIANLNKQFEPSRTPVDWLTRDKAVVDAYIADRRTQFIFTCNGFYTLFQTLKYLTYKSNLASMPRRLPVMFIAGAEDPVGNNGAGPKRVALQFQNLGMQHIDCRIYSHDRHEVLNELDKKDVWEDVLSFLHRAITPEF